MSIEHKTLAISALQQLKGDDLYRAQREFKGRSKDQMNKPWGQSGLTCAQILKQYEDHEAKVNAAIEWVKMLTPGL